VIGRPGRTLVLAFAAALLAAAALARLLLLGRGLFLAVRQYRLLGIGWSDLTAIRSTVPSASIRRRTRVGSPVLGSSSIALLWWIGASRSTIPPSAVGDARRCRLTTFTPWILIRPVLGKTWSTLPRFPFSSPEITWTVSPLVRCSFTRVGVGRRTRLAFL
jgi:hypothetical protein